MGGLRQPGPARILGFCTWMRTHTETVASSHLGSPLTGHILAWAALRGWSQREGPGQGFVDLAPVLGNHHQLVPDAQALQARVQLEPTSCSYHTCTATCSRFGLDQAQLGTSLSKKAGSTHGASSERQGHIAKAACLLPSSRHHHMDIYCHPATAMQTISGQGMEANLPQNTAGWTYTRTHAHTHLAALGQRCDTSTQPPPGRTCPPGRWAGAHRTP